MLMLVLSHLFFCFFLALITLVQFFFTYEFDSNRDSEPWRTYSEAMYSGALSNDTLLEILHWHQTQQGAGVRGSRLKLGVLSGCGGDVRCGDSLETFTVHGWGYGLLQADAVEAYLLNLYALSSHAYTRGTFIAPGSDCEG